MSNFLPAGFSYCSPNDNTIRDWEGGYVNVYHGNLYPVRVKKEGYNYGAFCHVEDTEFVPICWSNDTLKAEIVIAEDTLWVKMPVEFDDPYNHFTLLDSFYEGEDKSLANLLKVAEEITSYLSAKAEEELMEMETSAIWRTVRKMLCNKIPERDDD